MTTAHEIGHFIDYSGLGANAFASETDSALERWRKAVRESGTIKHIAGMKSMRPKRKAVFLSETEMFARSYAQYVAKRSADPQMLKELDRIRNGIEYWRQWKDDEFDPIASALDDLFKQKGWL